MTAAARRRVGVIGGGLAGIAAALRCADEGCAVTVYEAKPRLGGLTHSFQRNGLWVDNGQHVFLRCCTSYQALLRRLGVSDLVTVQPRLDITVRDASRTARLRRNRLPAPMQLSGSLARYPWLSPAQRLQLVRAALALRSVDPADPRTDERSFGSWLRDHGQNQRALDTLWDLVGIATLNARADDVSLALAATVFQIGLLTNRDAGDIGWSTVPLQELHGDAASRCLIGGAASVRTRTKVDGLGSVEDRWAITVDGTDDLVDDVVLAVPPPVAERLLPVGALDRPPRWSSELGSSPIINVHVVLDRRVLDEPFVAAVDSDVQWVFDRTTQARLGDGQYLAVSLSAADDLIDVPTAELRRRYLPALESLLPGMASATVRDFFVTRERDATFRPSPGTANKRGSTRTRLPGLYLAGAWTATGWPATMEGAVRSGDSAATALLHDSRRNMAQEVAA